MNKIILLSVTAICGGLLLQQLPERIAAHAHSLPTVEQRTVLENAIDRHERIRRMNRLKTYRAHSGVKQRAVFTVRNARLKAEGLSASARGRALVHGPFRAFPFSANPELGASGTQRTLTVMIDFKDHPAATAHPGITAGTISTNIYGDGSAIAQNFKPFESVRAYYRRASEGKLEIDGDVFGWVRLQNDRSNYEPNYPPGATEQQKLWVDNQALFELITEALDQLDANTDFSEYDNDNDGDIDLITVLYSGPNTNWGSFWWAYRWEFFISSASNKKYDGKRLKQFVFQFVNGRENAPNDYDPTVLIHEYGHALGLPDFYDYCSVARFNAGHCNTSISHPGPDGGIGGLDIMAANWGNHGALNRWLLDWIEPTVIKPGPPTEIVLVPSGSSNPGVKAAAVFTGLQQTNTPGQELFVIENRTRVGNDGGIASMPNDGLLIWHVEASPNSSNNDFNFDNSYTPTKLIRLVRAQSANDFPDATWANAQDYFTDGDSLTPATSPSSSGYGGVPTGITISDIVTDGENIRVKIGIPTAQPPHLVSFAAPMAVADGSAGSGETQPNLDSDAIDIEKLEQLHKDYRSAHPDELAKIWATVKDDIDKLDTDSARAIRARILLNQWAAKDGEAAVKAILAMPDSTLTQKIFPGIMAAWAQSDPQAANAWYFSAPDKARLGDRRLDAGAEFATEVFRWRALNDPVSAAKGIDSLKSAAEIYGAVSGLRDAAAISGASNAMVETQIKSLGANMGRANAIYDSQIATENVMREFKFDQQGIHIKPWSFDNTGTPLGDAQLFNQGVRQGLEMRNAQ